MSVIRIIKEHGLITEAQVALAHTQESLGELLGVSRRTMGRWVLGRTLPPDHQWTALARHVHRVDPALAARIAAAMGETLVSLGLVEAPPPAAPAGPPPLPPIPASDLVDSVVCAAAEAMATTPQAVRPGLLAAFDRAASVRLSLDEVRAALRPAPPARSTRDRPRRRAKAG